MLEKPDCEMVSREGWAVLGLAECFHSAGREECTQLIPGSSCQFQPRHGQHHTESQVPRHPSQSGRQTTVRCISVMSHYPLWARVRGVSVLQISVLMQIGNVALIVETRAKLTRSEKLDQVFGIKDRHRTCSFSRPLKALSVVSSIICFTELPNIYWKVYSF